MDDLELELKVGFIEEAAQLLQDAEQCFLQIESAPKDAAIINQLFRLAHNLKGSAKAVGFMELGAFTHVLESLLLKIKNNEIDVNSYIVSLLLESKDQLQTMLDGLMLDLNASFDTSQLCAKLQVAIDGKNAVVETTVVDVPNTEIVLENDLPLADSAGFVEAESEVANAADFSTEQHAESVSSEAPAEEHAEPAVTAEIQVAAPEKPKAVEPPKSNEKAKTPVVDETIRVSLQRVDQLNKTLCKITISPT